MNLPLTLYNINRSSRQVHLNLILHFQQIKYGDNIKNNKYNVFPKSGENGLPLHQLDFLPFIKGSCNEDFISSVIPRKFS